MIKFSLAGYYQKYRVNIILLTLYNLHKNWFRDNIIIDSAYGCLPGCPLNGCRIIYPIPECNPYTPAIYRLRDEYYELGISLRHTFANQVLPKEAFYDYRTLQWIKACEKEGNSIILVNPELKAFLQEKFPLYKYIWSTSLCSTDINRINDLSKDDMVVLHYGLNTDKEKLAQLQHPENVEIMVSENCNDNCPYRYKHYTYNSKTILNEEEDRYYNLHCLWNEQKTPLTFVEKMKNNKATLTFEQIEELHDQFGIKNFKIAGRDYANISYIESLVYYLIKPEYKDHVRELMLMELYNEYHD